MTLMKTQRRGQQGLTMIELLVVVVIATLIGGIMIMLLMNTTQIHNTHVTLSQLSGYLETATTQLKKDVWSANAAITSN